VFPLPAVGLYHNRNLQRPEPFRCRAFRACHLAKFRHVAPVNLSRRRPGNVRRLSTTYPTSASLIGSPRSRVAMPGTSR